MELNQWSVPNEMLYEHWGDNRSGKSAINAWMAYCAHKAGMTVYCNCPCQCSLSFITPASCSRCILLFPHYHLSPLDPNFGNTELTGCYIMTDQTASSGLDARTAMSVASREATYFGDQANKAGVEWHWDTSRHKNIDIRIRQSADWFVHSIRFPKLEKVWYDEKGYHDWPPVQAVKLRMLHRDGAHKSYTFYRPFLEKIFKLYRTEVVIRSQRRTEPINTPLLHKALVSP